MGRHISTPAATVLPTSRYMCDFEEMNFLGKGGFANVVKVLRSMYLNNSCIRSRVPYKIVFFLVCRCLRTFTSIAIGFNFLYSFVCFT